MADSRKQEVTDWGRCVGFIYIPAYLAALVACQTSLEIMSRGSMTDRDEHEVTVCMHVINMWLCDVPFFVPVCEPGILRVKVINKVETMIAFTEREHTVEPKRQTVEVHSDEPRNWIKQFLIYYCQNHSAISRVVRKQAISCQTT